MSESKHTPGPWFVFGNGHCVGGPTGMMDADPNQKTAGIAMCAMRLRTDDENEANARLIASAPELLAACEELVADLLSHAKFGMNDSEVAMLKRAEAAIRKARGEF
jgi:hypothetical protein